MKRDMTRKVRILTFSFLHFLHFPFSGVYLCNCLPYSKKSCICFQWTSERDSFPRYTFEILEIFY